MVRHQIVLRSGLWPNALHLISQSEMFSMRALSLLR